MKCFFCQKEHELGPQDIVGRRDSCSSCGRDLRVCKNCQHFDPASQWECREHISERVSDKEKANFCDDFRPRIPSAGSTTQSGTDSEKLWQAASSLFKKK